MTAPRPQQLCGWLLLAVCLGASVWLCRRAARHDRRLGVRVGIVAGAVVASALPALAVIVTQDLTCRDGGVGRRPGGGFIVVGVAAVALAGALWLLCLAGAMSTGTASGFAALALVLLRRWPSWP